MPEWIYRQAEGTLLRKPPLGEWADLQGFRGGTWAPYPGMLRDWLERGTPVDPADLPPEAAQSSVSPPGPRSTPETGPHPSNGSGRRPGPAKALWMEAWVKHLGPGPHPSGSEQEVHGSGEGGTGTAVEPMSRREELTASAKTLFQTMSTASPEEREDLARKWIGEQIQSASLTYVWNVVDEIPMTSALEASQRVLGARLNSFSKLRDALYDIENSETQAKAAEEWVAARIEQAGGELSVESFQADVDLAVSLGYSGADVVKERLAAWNGEGFTKPPAQDADPPINDAALQAKLEEESATAITAIETLVSEAVEAGATETISVTQPEIIEEWEELSGDLQAKVEENWKKDSLNEMIEQEKENWLEQDGPMVAQREVLTDRDWLKEKVDEWMDDEEYLKETGLQWDMTRESLVEALYDGDGEGKIDLTAGSLKWERLEDDPNQEELFGDPPEADKAKRWTTAHKEEFETWVAGELETEAERRLSNGGIEPPDYLEDSAKDGVDSLWGEKSDKEKFSEAEKFLDDDDFQVESQGDAEDEDVTLEEPSEWKPFSDGENYKLTGAMGRHIQTKRTAALFAADTTLPEEIRQAPEAEREALAKAISDTVWREWKRSSTSPVGLATQIAAAKEFGGYLRLPEGANEEQPLGFAFIGNHADTTISGVRSVSETSRAVLGQQLLRHYLRATWEATQYILAKADQKEVTVWRGIMRPEKEIDAELEAGRVEDKNNLTKLPGLSLLRNGAASATMRPDVANSWNGVGVQDMTRPTRVVIRVRAPREALISIPAFGQNVHEEEEVVILGTSWKWWDAWHKKAPTYNDQKAPTYDQ